ncbi:MAG TPA: hypothetical protein VFX16_22400 [Pseudonocardiaceae bacterium]|nr:hypothetical protein [Pseudonocardiaceae bacterium]
MDWLPLDGVPVSQPEESLAPPHVGYVMLLLEDMVAMRAICEPPDGELGPWYAEGGGLRRRLRLLARSAETLSVLHGRGIVYGDVSPGNVLVSAPNEHCEVWFVDADNLRIETSTVDRVLHTPFYAAPEIMRKLTGNTVHSDRHSFAVLAYQTLVADHPLLGDMVADDPEKYEQDALRGLLPWVGHATDDRNRTAHAGLDPRQVITTRLRQLFARTFEDGMTDPRARPSAGEWAEMLWAAADLTVTCVSCGQTFYVSFNRCSWCGASRPPTIVVEILDQYPPIGELRLPTLEETKRYLVLQPDHELTVQARTVRRSVTDPDAPVLRLFWDGSDHLLVRNTGTQSVRRVPPRGGSGRELQPNGRTAEQADMAWDYHFGVDRNPHRVLAIRPPVR